MSSKQKRQGIRMCVQRENDKIRPILENRENIDIEQLELSVKKLLSYKNDLQRFDDTVLAEMSDLSLIEQEITETANYNDSVLEIISQAELVIQSAKVLVPARNKSPPGDNSCGFQQNRSTLRLPKLELQPFSGDPLEFQSFWDSFENSVHNNTNLSDIDKFNYLRGLLKGDALKSIEGYRLTAANYSHVVETLCDRFGNKQTAIFAHFEAMLALPQATHDTARLQAIADACEQHIRSLVALGLDESTFGQVFTPIMLSKLPKFVKIELHRRNGSQSWSLGHLREWLKDEIRAREMGERSFGEGRSTAENTSSSSMGHRDSHLRDSVFRKQYSATKGKQPTSTSTLVSNAAPRDIKSAFCESGHYSDTCENFPDVNTRRAKANDRCFGCLSKDHKIKDCRRKIPCAHCKKRGHHRSLCYVKFGATADKTSGRSDENALNVTEAAKRTSENVMVTNVNRRTIMQTALATIVHVSQDIEKQARFLFDTAGSRSFITEQKRQELKLPIVGEEFVSVAGFQSKKRKTSKYKIVEFNVQCLDGTLQHVTASVVQNITCPIQKIPLDSEKYPILSQLVLAEPLIRETEFVSIDILIGLDHYYDFVTNERIQCPNGPLLLSSKLGYITTGRVNTAFTGPETIAVMLCMGKSLWSGYPTNSNYEIERHWNLEDVGIKDTPKELSGDDEALNYHSSTLERDTDGRYVSRWPWKCKDPELSDNFDVAYGRLVSLLRRLQSDNNILQAYKQTIDDQMAKGVIEVVPEKSTGSVVYYMPHHCVVTPAKATTKLRIVYDASSKPKKDALSLNDCLHRGPVLLGDLCGLLLRFRLQPIALVSDIEKAFLQIGLHSEERDVTRFLWVNDISKPPIGSNIVTYRFCRVPFGIISSPFVLDNTVSQHLLRTNTEVSLKILKNHYVDNIVTGEEDAEAAINHYKEAKHVFSSAQMNLREWYTNCPEVRSSIAKTDMGKSDSPKVLGMKWDCIKDVLTCEVNQDHSSASTKREVLKAVAQLFDPLGLFSPITVLGKILVQDMWKSGFDWDQPLSEDLKKRWSKIWSSLKSISVSEIPRFVGSLSNCELQLHVFCDASLKACAASVYLRRRADTTSSNLMMSKTRLSPTKGSQTIPRLELIAVVLGVRLLNFVEAQLRNETVKKFAWTDSQCTLHWINQDKVATRFVENRLKELKRNSDISFRYVPSEENPADLPSRGCDIQSLHSSPLWTNGPPWILLNEEAWPTFQISKVEKPEQTLVVREVRASCEAIVDGTRFSTLNKLIRTTAYVFRFISNLKKPRTTRIVGFLTMSELKDSRKYWISITQQKHFPELVGASSAKSVKGLGRQLGIFKDSTALLRCSGRISSTNIAYDAKYPLLLPKEAHFTDLVVDACHRRLLHAGVAETLAQVRHRFWIVHGRNTVKRILRKCSICTRTEGGPYRIPAPPDLPPERLSEEPAFTYTGLDYLGPLLVRDTERRNRKVWVCLLTCMVTRAVHLEQVDDMSTVQFLLALRRFVASFGCPRKLFSDNASQFHAADKTLCRIHKDVIKSREIQEFATSNGIQWNFVVDFAPWMGGFYERLVGEVKRSLRKTLNGALVTTSELMTVLCEITAVVNSRPLVYVENEVGAEVLTPAHFLGKSRKEFCLNPSTDDEFRIPQTSSDALIMRWKRLSTIGNSFWRTWRSQYLLSLRERQHVQRQRNCSSSTPKVGDVVQLKESSPRCQWRLGRICELFSSKDGLVRSVAVKLSNGKQVRRPIKLLYPIEMSACERSVADETHIADNQNLRRRVMPQRRTAGIAKSRWRQQLADSEQ